MRCFTIVVYIAVLLTAGSVFASARVPQEWSGIRAEVKADQPVETAQELIVQKDGFYRLTVTLTNRGERPAIVEQIEISVPVPQPLDPGMQMLYGGSCMGQTPVLRQAVKTKGRKSSSLMYAMIQAEEDCYIFAGSLSWRIFLPQFTVSDNLFIIRSEGEGKQIAPGQTVAYEQIVLAVSSDWMDLLDAFGNAIAKENGIRDLKPVEFKGWATWDYYGRLFTDRNVYDNMAEIKAVDPKANLIQIDGGWWTERGDYTSVRPDLRGGIKAVADRVRSGGALPGLHFDGFRGDVSSEIAKTHPEYFLHDQDGKLIVHTRELVDRRMDYIFFDYSHPGARAYITECIRVMREEWGFTYFKVDFMRYGLESEVKKMVPSLRSIRAYDPSLTSVERFRLGMQTIRDAIGKENYFLGCSAVFGPCIGFVDGMRTGADIHPRFDAFPERVLGNAGNFYLQKVFHVDADYLVFREAADEDEMIFKAEHKFGGTMPLNEAGMWADFHKLFGNCRLSSDNLMTLRPERKALIQSVFDYPAMDETVPLDLWERAEDKSDGFHLLLARKGIDVYLGVFNWGNEAAVYPVAPFMDEPIRIEPHHSKVFKYDGTLTFHELRKALRR